MTICTHPVNISSQLFAATLMGQLALIVLEGLAGREELVKYLKKYKHQVGAWNQVRV